MAKKDIGKILASGSLKQRALLIAEDIARAKYSQYNLLSDSDFNLLKDSFKKANEIKFWNVFKDADATVTNALTNLQGLLFEIKMNYSNLRGYTLVWNSIENAELLVNSVLHEVKDVKERRRMAEEGAKGINLLFSKTEPDQEGYIQINIDFERNTWIDRDGVRHKEKQRKTKEYSLWFVMNNVKQETETSIIKYLSWESAILDYMEDKGFNIKTYKDKIKEMTAQVYSPISWAKYSGEFEDYLDLTHNPRLEEVIKKYSICPNMDELKINKEEAKWFRKHIIGDE